MDKLSMSLDDIIKRNRRGPRNQNKNVKNLSLNQGRRQKRPSNKNKFGILNKSKRIGKNNRMKRNNSSFLQRNRPNRNKSDKLASLKSRLSVNKPIGQNKFRRIKPNLAPKRQLNALPTKRLQQPKRESNKANVAMKIARKNLEKAKRVLANRISKVKQIAAKINKNPKAQKRQNPRIKRLNNKPKMVNQNAFNKKKNLRSQVSRGRNNNRNGNRMVFY